MWEKYMLDDNHMNTHQGLPRHVRRESLYDDLMMMYKDFPEMEKEFPFRIKYVNERATDTRGVCRDMFSYFLGKAYVKHFNSERLLVPAIHPNTDMMGFSTLGTILVHGFMVCGFLPTRLSFPTIAAVLLGTEVNVTDQIFLQSLVNFIPSHDSRIIHEAIE